MSLPRPPHPVLSAVALAALYAHAQRDYPNECCGFVWGPRDRPVADRATACDNIQARLHAENPAHFMRGARTAYRLDLRDIVVLQESLLSDTPVRIVYHSHIDGWSHFSDLDQATARVGNEPAYPVEYVIVDIRADGPHGARQFAWNTNQRKYVEIGSYD
jgi:proteasome lid subunit RPN8/RPN11